VCRYPQRYTVIFMKLIYVHAYPVRLMLYIFCLTRVASGLVEKILPRNSRATCTTDDSKRSGAGNDGYWARKSSYKKDENIFNV
jgi:hypothetical protein